ncbi:MAG: hypothetical protein ACJ72O_01640 [Marmoricola sp.]
MSQLFTMLTAAVGVLSFAAGWMKVSECRNGIAVEPSPRGKAQARAVFLGVVGSVQAIAALGLTVPLLLGQGMWLVPVSAGVLVAIVVLGVLPAATGRSHYQLFMVMCAPAAFFGYTWAPGALGVPYDPDKLN